MEKKVIKKTAPITWILPLSEDKILNGILGMTQCPGKRCKGRNKYDYQRNLKKDFEFFKNINIKLIVCLLDKYELRTIGIDLNEYINLAKEMNIKILNIRIVEMSTPDLKLKDLEIFLDNILHFLIKKEKVIVHCRGGVGRAGLICGLVLKKLNMFSSNKKCLSYLRKKRHKNCVESQKQRDYLKEYFKNNN